MILDVREGPCAVAAARTGPTAAVHTQPLAGREAGRRAGLVEFDSCGWGAWCLKRAHNPHQHGSTPVESGEAVALVRRAIETARGERVA